VGRMIASQVGRRLDYWWGKKIDLLWKSEAY
jgi:hypothetical protein